MGGAVSDEQGPTPVEPCVHVLEVHRATFAAVTARASDEATEADVEAHVADVQAAKRACVEECGRGSVFVEGSSARVLHDEFLAHPAHLDSRTSWIAELLVGPYRPAGQ